MANGHGLMRASWTPILGPLILAVLLLIQGNVVAAQQKAAYTTATMSVCLMMAPVLLQPVCA